jgi:hypothetical protein
MQPKNGRRLSRSLALLILLSSCAGCPTKPGTVDTPPPMPVCIGDGKGEADCMAADETTFHATAQDLNGWWMTDAASMANFTAWCYGVKPDQTKPTLKAIEHQIKGEPNALPSPEAPR